MRIIRRNYLGSYFTGRKATGESPFVRVGAQRGEHPGHAARAERSSQLRAQHCYFPLGVIFIYFFNFNYCSFPSDNSPAFRFHSLLPADTNTSAQGARLQSRAGRDILRL